MIQASIHSCTARKAAVLFAIASAAAFVHADTLTTSTLSEIQTFQTGATVQNFDSLSAQNISDYTPIAATATIFNDPTQPNAWYNSGGGNFFNPPATDTTLATPIGIFNPQSPIDGDKLTANNVAGPLEINTTTAFGPGAFLEVLFPTAVQKIGFYVPFIEPGETLTLFLKDDTAGNIAGADSGGPLTAGQFIGITRPTADVRGLSLISSSGKFTIDDLTYTHIVLEQFNGTGLGRIRHPRGGGGIPRSNQAGTRHETRVTRLFIQGALLLCAPCCVRACPEADFDLYLRTTMSACRNTLIARYDGSGHELVADWLACEEPLEIRVRGKSIAVTMRTPGHDGELVCGFLVTEGLLKRRSDLVEIAPCQTRENAQLGNVLNVFVPASTKLDLEALTRHTFASSSCGLCGKASIESVHQHFPPVTNPLRISKEALLSLPEKLRAAQENFTKTGGVHAAGIFDGKGKLLVIREDVGRHNAVDKVVGWAFLNRRLPLSRHILFVSGRASFEIMQKALAARIPVIAAVSAPSSLAVDFAKESNQTLIGFVRGSSFNVYSAPERVREMKKSRRRAKV